MNPPFELAQLGGAVGEGVLRLGNADRVLVPAVLEDLLQILFRVPGEVDLSGPVDLAGLEALANATLDALQVAFSQVLHLRTASRRTCWSSLVRRLW